MSLVGSESTSHILHRVFRPLHTGALYARDNIGTIDILCTCTASRTSNHTPSGVTGGAIGLSQSGFTHTKAGHIISCLRGGGG